MVCVNAPHFDKALCSVTQLSQVKETHEEDIMIIIVVINDIVT